MAAFSAGVLASDNPAQIPDVNNVYQWYAYVDDDQRMHLNTVYRSFNPNKAKMPVFEETKFTVEAAIRRVLNVASQISVERLVHKYNKRVTNLLRRLVEESQTKNVKNFQLLFKQISDDAQEGGFLFLEPFGKDTANPPIVIEGNTFPNQGIRSAKRIRLIGQLDTGVLVPLRFLPNRREIAPGVQTGTGGRAFPSPWMDARLLCGSLALGNPKLFEMLSLFVNMLIPKVKFITTDNPNTGIAFIRVVGGNDTTEHLFTVPDGANANVQKFYVEENDDGNVVYEVNDSSAQKATFPTLFTYRDVQDIHSMITKDDIPLSHLPFYGDAIIRRINEIIRERFPTITRTVDIEPMKNLFFMDRYTVSTIAGGTRKFSDGKQNHHAYYIAGRKYEYELGDNGGSRPQYANAWGADDGRDDGDYTKEVRMMFSMIMTLNVCANMIMTLNVRVCERDHDLECACAHAGIRYA